MKGIVFLTLLAAVVVAKTPIESRFEAWARVHGKIYATEAERAHRLEVFAENIAEIEKLRQTDASGTRFAPTKFADLTHEEFRRFYLRPMPEATKKSILASGNVVRPIRTNEPLPDAFSWLDLGAVTPVKNQKQCGSCWAFGATGSMEGAWFLHGPDHKLVSLSEQNLVDCDHECQVFPGQTHEDCDQGCHGGMEPNAFNWVIKNKGIQSEEDYPYKGRDQTCNYDQKKAVAHLSNWTFVTCNEEALREFLHEHGPVSIGVYADSWSWYSGGVYDSSCGTANDHAVLLVGWGIEGKKPFWIVKNSWGTGWGEDGYIRLIRGKNKCGLLELDSLPIV